MHHVKAFDTLLSEATVDCHLLSEAATEIPVQLEELDINFPK